MAEATENIARAEPETDKPKVDKGKGVERRDAVDGAISPDEALLASYKQHRMALPPHLRILLPKDATPELIRHLQAQGRLQAFETEERVKDSIKDKKDKESVGHTTEGPQPASQLPTQPTAISAKTPHANDMSPAKVWTVAQEESRLSRNGRVVYETRLKQVDSPPLGSNMSKAVEEPRRSRHPGPAQAMTTATAAAPAPTPALRAAPRPAVATPTSPDSPNTSSESWGGGAPLCEGTTRITSATETPQNHLARIAEPSPEQPAEHATILNPPPPVDNTVFSAKSPIAPEASDDVPLYTPSAADESTAIGDASDDSTPSVMQRRAARSDYAQNLRRWINTTKRYGPTDWLNSTFAAEDSARDGHGADPNMFNDGATERTADRLRLPTLMTDGVYGRALGGVVCGTGGMGGGMVASLGGRKDRQQKAGPMEPTSAMYLLRMSIMGNFAARCREAAHTAVEVVEVRLTEGGGIHAGAGVHLEVATIDADAAANDDDNCDSEPTTPPLAKPLCRQCARANDFAMREQHGRMFLEQVLLPLSQACSYADMVLHVNTSVRERIYADAGLDNAHADAPALRWEDIKAMPIYEDFQGALVLATHRWRVEARLPVAADAFGMVGRKR